MKSQATGWKKISVAHINNKGLLLRINKEIQTINKKKSKLNRKSGQEISNKNFTGKDI